MHRIFPFRIQDFSNQLQANFSIVQAAAQTIPSQLYRHFVEQ
jgi:hypothetical protein